MPGTQRLRHIVSDLRLAAGSKEATTQRPGQARQTEASAGEDERNGETRKRRRHLLDIRAHVHTCSVCPPLAGSITRFLAITSACALESPLSKTFPRMMHVHSGRYLPVFSCLLSYNGQCQSRSPASHFPFPTYSREQSLISSSIVKHSFPTY